jgi:hypothetical protein
MKLKFIAGVLLLFGMTELNGQNLESDSIYKYQFRNRRQFERDLESESIRKPSKKTTWEYDHYHINITDSTFMFSKTKVNIVNKFSIKVTDIYDENVYLKFLYAENSCGGEINVKITYDDIGYYVVVYFIDPKNKYSAIYFHSEYNF